MGANLYHEIVHGESRTVQSKGEITLPAEWRAEHDVEPKDEVAIRETDDGRLEVIPPE